MFVVNSYFSTDVAFVNSSNLFLGYNFSSNKSVNKLPYLSFGMNLTIDGFITVPSLAPLSYSKTLSSACLICKVIFWVMALFS